jgi:hypothetical protein
VPIWTTDFDFFAASTMARLSATVYAVGFSA